MRSFMSSFSSSSSSKPNAHTRSAAAAAIIDGATLPTWTTYYTTFKASNNYQPPSPKLIDHTKGKYKINSAINDRVKLYQGDITKLNVSAIVNAANDGLWAGGGICGAIHKAAGSELEAECELWISKNRICPAGSTVVTSAYRLPAEYVFHSVGPMNGDPQILRSCYRSCLDWMIELRCRSIAFCCIATGIFGFDNYHASYVATTTVREWLEEEPNRIKAIDFIIFCTFLDKDRDIYQRMMQSIFPVEDINNNQNQQQSESEAEKEVPSDNSNTRDNSDETEMQKGGVESKEDRDDASPIHVAMSLVKPEDVDSSQQQHDSSQMMTRQTQKIPLANDEAGEADHPAAAQNAVKDEDSHSSK